MSWSFCCVRAPFVCKITVIWRIYGWLSKKKAFKNWKNTGLVVSRPPRNSSVWFSWTAMLVFIFNLTFSLRLYWEKICWICCCMTLTTMGPSPMTGTSTCFGKAWWKVHFMRLAWEQKFKDFVRLPTLPPGKPGTPFSPFSPTPPKPWGKTSTLNLWSVCNLTAQP